jgi:hypothetical protein
VALEAIERFHVLSKDAQGAGIFTRQEADILIGLGLTMAWLASLVQRAPRFYPVVVPSDE